MQIKIKEVTVLVNKEDHDYLTQWKWQRENRFKTNHHSISVKRIDNRKGKHNTLYMQRVIYERAYGEIPINMFVIQKKTNVDRTIINYKRDNIELSTTSMLMSQIRKNKDLDRTSQFKGVHWVTSEGKWRACIRYDGKKYTIGRFVDEVLAAEAYDKKAVSLNPDFKILNFPENRQQYLSKVS